MNVPRIKIERSETWHAYDDEKEVALCDDQISWFGAYVTVVGAGEVNCPACLSFNHESREGFPRQVPSIDRLLQMADDVAEVLGVDISIVIERKAR